MIKINEYSFEELSVIFTDPQVIIRIPAEVSFESLEKALAEAGNHFVYNDVAYDGYEKLVSIAKETRSDDYPIEYIFVIALESNLDAAAIIAGDKISIKEAYEIRASIEDMTQNVPDEDAQDYIWAFPDWKIDTFYKINDRVAYFGYLYKCLQNHTSQSDWDPASAVSLWAKVINVTPSGDIPVWTQPSSTNPYMKGDKVYYPTENDAIYESLIDNNVWSPRDYPNGWAVVE